MKRQKYHHSKVFQGYNFDIGIDRDSQHQKVWTDKIQQTKQVQQMKQIDKIFRAIVKQRIFGTIITQKSRLSNQQYSKLDKLNKTINSSTIYNASLRNTNYGTKFYQSTPTSPSNKIKNTQLNTSRINFTTARKNTLQPLNFTSQTHSITKKQRSFTIDQSKILQISKKLHQKDNNQQHGSKTPNLSTNLNINKFPSPQKHSSGLIKSKTDISKSITTKKHRKQSSIILKQMNLMDNDPFEDHFKNLSTTPNIFLYDIKVSKQTIISKTQSRVNPRLLEYFFHFFGFPPVMNFRQFKNGIQKAFNSPVNLIYFFTFRVLDESGNGFLTVSDLFRFLQKYPETSYIEKEIYKIRQIINENGKQLLKLEEEKKHVKASLEQILIVNHKLKADEVSELLKQSIKQEINKGGQVKITCYTQSILSLQHDVGVRLKQYELQNQKNESQAMNTKNNQKDSMILNQDGLRFTHFAEIFNGRRPKIFCLLVNVLTGMNNDEYE